MNKCFISGNVARDPDVRSTNDNTIAKFSVGVSRGKDKGTDWISCVAFGKTADLIEKYVHKGDRVTIADGSIRTGSYEKDGTKVYTTDVIVNSIEFAPKNAEREITTEQMMAFVNTPAKKADDFMKIPDNVADEGLPFN